MIKSLMTCSKMPSTLYLWPQSPLARERVKVDPSAEAPYQVCEDISLTKWHKMGLDLARLHLDSPGSMIYQH